ncbi:Hypothetical_protein [Hexamita inflata]|uniref:Hypothetical_protein n=1 Tax=Hexamita inflata TaxID=28002 RepID=A0ABP1GUM6_9EUKA
MPSKNFMPILIYSNFVFKTRFFQKNYGVTIFNYNILVRMRTHKIDIFLFYKGEPEVVLKMKQQKQFNILQMLSCLRQPRTFSYYQLNHVFCIEFLKSEEITGI